MFWLKQVHCFYNTTKTSYRIKIMQTLSLPIYSQKYSSTGSLKRLPATKNKEITNIWHDRKNWTLCKTLKLYVTILYLHLQSMQNCFQQFLGPSYWLPTTVSYKTNNLRNNYKFEGNEICNIINSVIIFKSTRAQHEEFLAGVWMSQQVYDISVITHLYAPVTSASVVQEVKSVQWPTEFKLSMSSLSGILDHPKKTIENVCA